MKAVAVAPGRREVSLVDHEEPRLTEPTHVKLRMLDVGVCGTDREICAFQYGTPPAGESRLVIGHEALGEVLEVGGAVSRLVPGDLVIPMVRRPCPHAHCTACRAGRQDFCFTGDFAERGISKLHGFMTELVVDDERYMHAVARALRDVAILVEPLTIAEKALLQIDDIQERLPWACELAPDRARRACRRAVVLGAGPVGLLGAMALVARGFETAVYSREPAPNAKSALAEAIGARYYSAGALSPAQLAERVGNVDVVYEATGASGIAFEMMKALGTNGIFVFTGVPGRKAPIEIDTDTIMRNLVLRNQVVFGTVNAGHDAFAAAVADLGLFVERWPAAVQSLVTGRHPIEAYRDLLTGPAQGIKNVLTFA
ncbi:MAG TPA: glucose 1-dehydrogenase [Candidatus Limnocylindria bacterium]|nr:glucose 1-dehydrogenase [Candidatus Limnocylindria bacterium]